MIFNKTCQTVLFIKPFTVTVFTDMLQKVLSTIDA